MEEDQYQIESTVYDRICVVCGKSVDYEHASAHLRVGTEMIAICCQLCNETYQKRPDHFLALRALRAAEARTIHRADGSFWGQVQSDTKRT